MSPLAVLLIACAPVGPVGSTTGTTDQTSDPPTLRELPGLHPWTADSLAQPPGWEGCGPEGDEDTATGGVELQASLSQWMATVVHVAWTDVPGVVRYDDGQVQRVAQAHQTADGYETWLIGVPAQTDVTFWLEPDDGSPCSDARTIRTADLVITPVPAIVEAPSGAAPAEGLVSVSWFGDPGTEQELRSGMALLDRKGEAVWLASALEGYRIAAAEWTTSGVWTLQEVEEGSLGGNLVVWIGADGQIGDLIGAPESHHDLVVFPDGQPGWLEIDVRAVDDLGPVAGDAVDVVGDRLVRLGADGTTSTLWDSWASLPLEDESLTWESGFYDEGKDWTHANGLDLNGAGDKLLISLLGLARVLEIDVASGAVLRTLDGQTLQDTESRFLSQHSPTWSDVDRILLFVNAPEVGAEFSFAAEFDLALDPVQEVWDSGKESTPFYSQALGRVAALGADRVMVNYGQEGVLEEIDRSGDPLWRWFISEEWVLGESGVVTLWED